MVRSMEHRRSSQLHHAAFYRTESGEEPVRVFLEQLSPRHRDAVRRQIDHACLILDATGLDPEFPRTSHVHGPIRELRCHFGRSLYRVLYARSGSLVILLHAFTKRQRRLASRDIDIAMERLLDFNRRMRKEMG